MVDEPLKKIFQFLYGPPIAVICFFMRNYKANHARLDKFLDSKKVSSILQFVAIAILIMWLFIFSFSTEGDRKGLTEQVKQRFSELKAIDTK